MIKLIIGGIISYGIYHFTGNPIGFYILGAIIGFLVSYWIFLFLKYRMPFTFSLIYFGSALVCGILTIQNNDLKYLAYCVIVMGWLKGTDTMTGQGLFDWVKVDEVYYNGNEYGLLVQNQGQLLFLGGQIAFTLVYFAFLVVPYMVAVPLFELSQTTANVLAFIPAMVFFIPFAFRFYCLLKGVGKATRRQEEDYDEY